MSAMKRLICTTADLLGAFAVGQAWRRRAEPYVRAVNYHATPAAGADGLRRQLAFYQRHFKDTPPRRLDEVLAGEGRGASILISFDDGHRSNYDVAAPLLEEHGFTGWFFVSSGRVRTEHATDRATAGYDAGEYMSHAEMRDLIARGHVVGCHTHSHVRLSESLTVAELHGEIVRSRQALAHALADPIDNFCWVGGERWSYSARAAQAIRDAGYARAFMTNLQIITARTDPLWLQRTNLEADWPLSVVRFYLSGIMDIAYHRKRREISRRLGAEGSLD